MSPALLEGGKKKSQAKENNYATLRSGADRCRPESLFGRGVSGGLGSLGRLGNLRSLGKLGSLRSFGNLRSLGKLEFYP